MEEKQSKFKKFIKPISIALGATLVLGGAGSFAYAKYENSQKLKEREAYSSILSNQASKDNVSLKSQDDVKKIVSESISVSQDSITFNEIYLTNKDKSKKNKDGKKNSAKMSNNSQSNVNNNTDNNSSSTNNDSNSNSNNSNNSTNNSSTPTMNYYYKVKAEANGMKYDLIIDAKEGKVLDVKVDS